MGAEFFRSGAPRLRPDPAHLRQGHRWFGALFLLAVAANITAMIRGAPPAWITYAPLPPLFLVMASGLVMLVAPALQGWRAHRTGKGVKS